MKNKIDECVIIESNLKKEIREQISFWKITTRNYSCVNFLKLNCVYFQEKNIAISKICC